MRNPAAPDRHETLFQAIDRVGYYPAVVGEAVRAALAGEEVMSFVVHHEPTFDMEEIRRHITVLTLTPTRLLVTHTDEHPADDLVSTAYTSTSTEAVPVQRIDSVAVTRIVPNTRGPNTQGPNTRGPNTQGSNTQGPDGPRTAVAEGVLTIGWGTMRRVDLEPATCGDPECEADHGYTGVATAEDFTIRVSEAADGGAAVQRLLGFAHTLSTATTVRM